MPFLSNSSTGGGGEGHAVSAQPLAKESAVSSVSRRSDPTSAMAARASQLSPDDSCQRSSAPGGSAAGPPLAEAAAALKTASAHSAPPTPAVPCCDWPDQDLADLAERMAYAIEVRDRFRHFKKYRSCFTGRQAVKWLLETAAVACDEAEAVAIGNALLHRGLLHHVQYKHPFENRSHLYRFDGVGPEHNDSSDDDASAHGWNVKLRTTNSKHWTLGEEVSRLQRRMAHAGAELQMLRATDALLHESHMRLQRGQLRLARRLEGAEAALEQSQFNTTVIALLQTVGLLLLVLLYCGATAAADPALGMRMHGIDARYWLPALALLPAVPLAFFLWEECCRARRRGGSAAISTAPDALSDPLLPGYSGSVSSVSSVGGDGRGGGGDADGDAFFSDEGATAAPSGAPSTISEDQSEWSQHGADAPSAAVFRGWQDAPGLLRLRPGCGQRLTDGGDPTRIPLNSDRPIQFETDSFVGAAAIWVRDLPTAPADLWKGKRRRSKVVVQGRFKQRICMEDVITGQEFARATNMPAKWLVEQVLLKVARAINPSVEIGPMSAPSVLVPVVAMAQAFAISEPGQQPDLCSFSEDGEDARLLGPDFRERSGKPVSFSARKAHFASADNRQKAFFEPDKVYTFCIYQHLVNLGKYELDLSVYNFDLAHYLDGQPLQFMMRPRGDKQHPHFAFEMWHEKLLPAAQQYHG